ncbi:hypothetical protein BB560_000600 [Smittium megazygosporum]|uniref:Cytochrome b-c1 complex subunit 8 n=1 Tax=Smittium megazygosporum TaxID=133381 RepID=A0A2T9ZJX3_9FUNG|nr:hypothetical protein BB560_000600 [Smittium megazygosporum]
MEPPLSKGKNDYIQSRQTMLLVMGFIGMCEFPLAFCKNTIMGEGYSGIWGDMKGPKERGFVSYRLSPTYMKPFKGWISQGPVNVLRRASAQVPYILPAVFLLWGVTYYGKTKYAYLHSKAGHAEGH